MHAVKFRDVAVAMAAGLFGCLPVAQTAVAGPGGQSEGGPNARSELRSETLSASRSAGWSERQSEGQSELRSGARSEADSEARSEAWSDVFVDIGVQATRMRSEIANQPATINRDFSGLHLGVGVRRSIGPVSDLGFRVEFDRLGSHNWLSVRPLDYRLNLSRRFAWTAFLGVSRLSFGTPAYGWYLGTGLQIKDVLPSWDFGMDVRMGDRLARDNLLPSDPHGGSPDNFHTLYSLSAYLSYRF